MLRHILTLFVCVVGVFAAGCVKNNCYNAFTNSLAIASPFCSSYIRSTETIYTTGPQATTVTTFTPVTTNARLSSRCVLDTNAAGVQSTSLSLRLSSACTCINVVPDTVTVTVIATPAPRPCENLPAYTPPAYPGSQEPSFYTDSRGNLFYFQCNRMYGDCLAIAGNVPASVDTTYNFESCMEGCRANTDCYLVNYVHDPDSNRYSCYYFQRCGYQTSGYNEVDSAALGRRAED